MNFSREQVSGIEVLRILETRLDSNVAPQLKVQFLDLFGDDPAKKVLINLNDVDYADSSGLGAILFGVRQSREHESALKFSNISSRVMSLIRIAKLESIIDAYASEEEAIASY